MGNAGLLSSVGISEPVQSSRHTRPDPGVAHQTRTLVRALSQHLDRLRLLGVTSVPVPLGASGRSKEARLAHLVLEVDACRRCPLYRTRTHAVVSDGIPHAKLVFVGEAPGREEDLQGKPFVGAAGMLLTKMIEAIGMRRNDVYICNVLKDRPPANRTPLPEEVNACWPFLQEQLAIVQPRVICTLGAVAAKALLGPSVSITKIRGRVLQYEGMPVVPTFHPAYLLRNPAAKKFAWADLKLVKKLIDG